MRTRGKLGLGRRFSPDERDARYLMSRLLAPAAEVQLPARKTWAINARNLDQGQTGTCVGHAWQNFLRAAPLQTTGKTAPDAFEIYRVAVTLDEWTDNDNEADAPIEDLQSGTSVRAGAEAVMKFGRLKSYVWGFSLQPVVEFASTQGPVVLGINWYSSFFDPDAEGIIKIAPRASIAGGHAILMRGIDNRRGLARLSNSWGDEWGISGECFLPLRDLERLISEDGEACAAVEQRVKAAA